MSRGSTGAGRRRRVAGVGVALVLVGTALGATSCGSDDAERAGGTSSVAGARGGASSTLLEPAAFAAEAAREGLVVLDVRTPEEFAEGHLSGALEIDIAAPDFADRVDALDRATTYAVYCRTGNRSAVAMDHLRAAGFTSVVELAGGIVAWQAAGLPVTTG